MLVDLLTDSFRVLEAQAPAHARMLAGHLECWPVVLECDGERVRPEVHGDRLVATCVAENRPDDSDLVEARIGPLLSASATAEAVLDLLEGRISLLDALRQGRLEARGHRRAMSAAEQGMRIFLHGLARCADAPALLNRLRRHVSAGVR